MKYYFVIVLVFIIVSAKAQQAPYNDLYLYNHYLLNPAAAASGGSTTIGIQARKQWMNTTAQNQNAYASVASPLKDRMAIGFKVSVDKTLFENRNSLLASYVYRFPLLNGNLSLGIDAGIRVLQWKAQHMDLKDNSDPVFPQQTITFTKWTSNFGAYYHNESFYFGLSIFQLPDAGRLSRGNYTYVQIRQYYLMSGKEFRLNNSWSLNPSILIRSAGLRNHSADLNLALGKPGSFWFGLSAKSVRGAGLFFSGMISKNIRAGYSINANQPDAHLSLLLSHEINLNIFLSRSSVKPVSIRYFN